MNETQEHEQTPEPFEWFAHWYTDSELGPIMCRTADSSAPTVWRCTVTPIERVR